MAAELPTSDIERNKQRKLLLSKTPLDGYLDFSRPMIVVSREAIRQGKAAYPPEVPLRIKMAAGWPAQHLQAFVVDNLDEPLPIQATPEERARFERGEALLVRANIVGMRPERSSGGQLADDIEKQIKDVFAVNVFVIYERLRHLVPLRDGKNLRNWTGQEAAQNFIFDKELLPLPWPEHDHRTTVKSRRRLIDTAWRNGQRQKFLRCLYPGNRMRREIAAWAEGFHGKRKDVIEEEIRFQKTQFVALNMCRERAKEFRIIESKISEITRRETDGDGFLDPKLAAAAVGFNHPIDAGTVFPAVYAGDFDPRVMFCRLASLKGFEFVRQLGRIARRQPATSSPGQIAEQVERNWQRLEAQPEMFSERLHPELMSGREFLLYAYAIFAAQWGDRRMKA
ncbi:hypothetical protein [Bradyrhizobium sp.]|jgi:hypothetical protein|uniref:hypothetical protein n=1 Tax=Bradyrhizobium sp. TaxID=376 RepID=UPI00391C7AEE